MARPPMYTVISFNHGEYNIIVYDNHTQPDNTIYELTVLQNAINAHVIDNNKNIIVLGDLNADNNAYMPGGFEANPILFNVSWERIFLLTDKTNTLGTYAYDKIIPNSNMAHSFSGDYGIVNVSQFNTQPANIIPFDHNLIWATFSQGGVESDNTSYWDKLPVGEEDGCNQSGPPVLVNGIGFVPLIPVEIYITNFPVIQDMILIDVRGDPTPTTTTAIVGGVILPAPLWNTPLVGVYNIIVDVNLDGVYTESIDVIDNFNGFGFQVNECWNTPPIRPNPVPVPPEPNPKRPRTDCVVKSAVAGGAIAAWVGAMAIVDAEPISKIALTATWAILSLVTLLGTVAGAEVGAAWCDSDDSIVKIGVI